MSILAVAFVLAQTAPVTYRSAAQTVAVALEALSKQTGLAMQATGKIRDDVIVIDVKDAPLNDLQQRIAIATTGEWTRDGSTLVLQRDEGKAKRQEQDEIARQAARYAKGIQELVKPVVDIPTLSSQEAEKRLKQLADLNDKIRQSIDRPNFSVDFSPAGTPQERLIARILQVFDPRELAILPADTRFVYSSKPTSMQRPLPNAASRALTAFATEYDVWQSLVERYRPVDSESTYVDFGSFGAMKSRPAKVLLIVSKWGEGMGVSCELKVVDEVGNVLTTASSSIDAAGDNPGKEEQAAPPPGEKPIQLSPDGRQIEAIRGGAMRGVETAPISADLRNKLLRPEQFEPLSFNVSDILLGIGDASGKNFVAVVPDSAFDAFWGAGSITPTAAREAVTGMELLKFEGDDKWLVAAPGWPSSARARRVSRGLLGQLMRDLEKPGASSLDALSKFALRAGGAAMPTLAASYLGTVQPQVAANNDYSSYELLKVYASLSPTQRASMRDRGQVAVGSLDGAGQNALARMIFYGLGTPQLMGMEAPAQTEGDVVQNFESIRTEPTEALPGGLPPQAILNFEFSSQNVAFATGGIAFTAEDLGTQLAMRERPEIFPFVTESPLPAKYSISARTTVNITLMISQQAAGSYMLNDFRTGDGKLYGLGELPPAFRAQMDKARQESREAFKNIPQQSIGSGSGSNIPPNP